MSNMMVSQKLVTPVKTGVQRLCNCFNILDSGVRRNDEKRAFGTFCETIKPDMTQNVTKSKKTLRKPVNIDPVCRGVFQDPF